ncbi:AMP-binding protein, partial [Streptomyces hydrogenans]|uniref:AMP-binding protein n=1 Tax=Streptomyces hydrogenans TaxID=1873719 RepID=UPI0038035BA6
MTTGAHGNGRGRRGAAAGPGRPGAPGRRRRRAAASPDATAVVCGATRLTDAELDARADRLAHRLRRRGAGPERLVAVAV